MELKFIGEELKRLEHDPLGHHNPFVNEIGNRRVVNIPIILSFNRGTTLTDRLDGILRLQSRRKCIFNIQNGQEGFAKHGCKIHIRKWLVEAYKSMIIISSFHTGILQACW